MLHVHTYLKLNFHNQVFNRKNGEKPWTFSCLLLELRLSILSPLLVIPFQRILQPCELWSLVKLKSWLKLQLKLA